MSKPTPARKQAHEAKRKKHQEWVKKAGSDEFKHRRMMLQLKIDKARLEGSIRRTERQITTVTDEATLKILKKQVSTEKGKLTKLNNKRQEVSTVKGWLLWIKSKQ